MTCPLCTLPAGELLYEDTQLWVLLVDEAGYPGFCRVIWKQHVREMTDLPASAQSHLLDWVLRTESAVRQVMQPDKINLASLGNVVPHLHWHVIPRFEDDAHFPAPIWAQPQRAGADHAQPQLAAQLRQALQAGLAARG
ncbi:MAG: HIT family protein [Aquitalea sp.]|nr:HIT family protein [Aquitalea sp.]